jgi:hypothetical protein
MDSVRKAEHLKMSGVGLKIELKTSEIRGAVLCSVIREWNDVCTYILLCKNWLYDARILNFTYVHRILGWLTKVRAGV